MDTLSLILDDMHFDGVVFASSVNAPPWSWHLAVDGLASGDDVRTAQAIDDLLAARGITEPA